MVGRRLGWMLGVLGATMIAGLAAGCTAGMGPTGGGADKVGSTTQALIQTDPTPPTTFPIPTERLMDCALVAPRETVPVSTAYSAAWLYGENYVAFPVHDTTDPNRTQYTHGYTYGDCAQSGSLNCQLESDFFGIPSANGFKYEVAQLTQVTRQLHQSTQAWYLEGLARADETWEMYPWNAGGNGIVPWCANSTCANGQDYFDASSHPPDGTNAEGADWAELWNLTWTYSYDANPVGPNNASTSSIQSTLHTCAFVYVCPGGTKECAQDSDCPTGQSCDPDLDDPGMTCWANCYNYQTGTFDHDPHALVLQDFFVAAEKHDPYTPPW